MENTELHKRMSQQLYPLQDLNQSDLRTMLFPALFEEENNLIKLQEIAQFVKQKELMRKLFLIKINQNFDLKSSNMYRSIAEQIGLNLEEENIQESHYFEQSEIPSFYQYIEQQENSRKLKRSSSFTCLIDGFNQEEKKMFFEIQNTFFGRIPLYVKAFISGSQQQFEIHNSLNRIIFMESNPFDLPSIYCMINEVCSFLKCEYAENLFLSIQDYQGNSKIKHEIFTHDLLTVNYLESSSSNSNPLLIELIQSILLGIPLTQTILSAFTKQQIYFAFFLAMHITKICTISFGLGLKNELDLEEEDQKQPMESNSQCQLNQQFEGETILCQLFNKEENNDPKEDDKITEHNSNQKFSESSSIRNLDETTNSISSCNTEEDDVSTDIVLQEMNNKIKSTSKYSNIVNLQTIEHQDFLINTIEPYLNNNLVQIVDEAYKLLKHHETNFEQETILNKECLYGYIECLLHIKNYQFNPKTLEEIPKEIKKFIKYLVFNPHKLDKQLVLEVKKYLPSFELYSEFVEYISECIVFANLTIFQYENNL